MHLLEGLAQKLHPQVSRDAAADVKDVLKGIDALVYLVFKVEIPPEDVSKIMSNMVDMEKVRTLFGYGHGIKMLDFNSILKNE